jgi:hypothetical protein
VTGGNFTMINHAAPQDPPGNLKILRDRKLTPEVDFRTIPFGDLNLLQEVRHDRSRVDHLRKGRVSTKRMYTVRIPGMQSVMPAAVFQGEGAEEVRPDSD